ncbi:flagellar basal-body rod protein FlgF [Lysobacter humi (ex Lee et al. 2017)]
MIDKSLYIAMTGASASLRAQAGVAQNLANADTVGFQATLTATTAVPVTGQGLGSRVAAMPQMAGVSGAPGQIRTTGNDLDVALHPDRWLAVQAPDGSTAYTRAGDLQLTANGLLTTAGGLPVLDAGGAPLSVPPHQTISIGGDGTISIVPQGQPASTITEAGRLQVVAAKTTDLVRGEDGLFRTPPGADAPPPAAGAALVSGAVEGSNVQATTMLVSMIQLARQFEMQVRVLQSGDENARSSNSLLSSR